MQPTRPPPSSSRLCRYAPVTAAAAAGLLLSLLLFSTIRRWEKRELDAELQAYAHQRLEILQETLGNALEMLHALGSLYDADGHVDRASFRRFVQGALGRRPELHAFSWTPRVPPAERTRYETLARLNGLADFTFTERDPATGRIVPAAPRTTDYYPVYFIEPLERNRLALGYDLASRSPTLETARDQAAAISTPPLRLIQETADAPGFIVYLPLYRDGLTPATVEARRAAHVGYVAAVFRIGDLVRPALADLPGLRITLRDAGTATTVYTSPPAPPGPRAPGLSPCHLALPFAGREWRITFTPTPSFLAGRHPWQSWAVLAAGLLLTALACAYLAAHLRRSEESLRANLALQNEVAERKRAEAEAAAANRAKSDFLANLSHEIRTPLNSILGYSQILERDRDLPLRHRDAIAALSNSGHHLLGLLNTILDLAKIEAGRMDLRRDAFDPVALVQGLVEMFKPRCLEKNLALRTHGLAHAPRSVLGDEGKLRQVLINLIGNAVKFTHRGEIYIGLRPSATGPWLFEVIDTGPGLSPEEQSALFAPFHQTETGRLAGGTGLGLTIARRQVELMGGRLEVQSSPGEGSRFHFTLPLENTAANPPATTNPALPRLCAHIAVRALAVDDNRDNLHILARLLTELGCTVASAADPAHARQLAAHNPPDILFLDVRLATTTGAALLDQLRHDGLPASVPVVFHTAALLDRAKLAELRALGADVLAKPFRTEDLCTCLRRLPGVRFDDAPPTPEPALAPPDLDTLHLPEDLCSRMTVAAELHSTTLLKACLEELRQHGAPAAALADHLRQLLRAYDLEAISRLLARLPARTPRPVA